MSVSLPTVTQVSLVVPGSLFRTDPWFLGGVLGGRFFGGFVATFVVGCSVAADEGADDSAFEVTLVRADLWADGRDDVADGRDDVAAGRDDVADGAPELLRPADDCVTGETGADGFTPSAGAFCPLHAPVTSTVVVTTAAATRFAAVDLIRILNASTSGLAPTAEDLVED